jgi:hypothetical protein
LSPPPKAPTAAPRPTSAPARAPSGGARKR